jgi:hypothetical protein
VRADMAVAGIAVLAMAVGILAGAGAEPRAAPAASEQQADGDEPYTVVCESVNDRRECRVDQETYVGWRSYHGFCAQCHGQDAVGSTFAPGLLEVMPRIDREHFDRVVAEGFQGQIGVMPGFADNPNVMPRLDEMYAYLSARADGALERGRPQRLPRE